MLSSISNLGHYIFPAQKDEWPDIVRLVRCHFEQRAIGVSSALLFWIGGIVLANPNPPLSRLLIFLGFLAWSCFISAISGNERRAFFSLPMSRDAIGGARWIYHVLLPISYILAITLGFGLIAAAMGELFAEYVMGILRCVMFSMLFFGATAAWLSFLNRHMGTKSIFVFRFPSARAIGPVTIVVLFMIASAQAWLTPWMVAMAGAGSLFCVAFSYKWRKYLIAGDRPEAYSGRKSNAPMVWRRSSWTIFSLYATYTAMLAIPVGACVGSIVTSFWKGGELPSKIFYPPDYNGFYIVTLLFLLYHLRMRTLRMLPLSAWRLSCIISAAGALPWVVVTFASTIEVYYHVSYLGMSSKTSCLDYCNQQLLIGFVYTLLFSFCVRCPKKFRYAIAFYLALPFLDALLIKNWNSFSFPFGSANLTLVLILLLMVALGAGTAYIRRSLDLSDTYRIGNG